MLRDWSSHAREEIRVMTLKITDSLRSSLFPYANRRLFLHFQHCWIVFIFLHPLVSTTSHHLLSSCISVSEHHTGGSDFFTCSSQHFSRSPCFLFLRVYLKSDHFTGNVNRTEETLFLWQIFSQNCTSSPKDVHYRKHDWRGRSSQDLSIQWLLLSLKNVSWGSTLSWKYSQVYTS